ncbi:MgtC/SapB family protein [Lentibacillus daqui]|uniref:MgtC/SapB family protein n=1 Tax=Lentibacillus daqui TaxID=2911514 RepID=UPI0022B18977|nr:MgtC/SapB family protein [Lentibacillus daqui]
MFDYEMLLRLVISAVLGLVIGLEREYKGKPLGLKTCLVISITSCLLTIVSIQSAYIFPDSDYITIRMDPLRLAAQIVSGVGFLGAGVILRREDDTISGLTTAAMVWGAAGVGLATGAGFYVESIVGVVLLMGSVELLPALSNHVKRRFFHSRDLTLRIGVKDRGDIPDVIAKVEKEVRSIKKIRIKESKDRPFLIVLKVNITGKLKATDLYMKLSQIEGVETMDIRE